MKCPQVFEVGVYVLGALSPAEREAFEVHLAGCAICRDEVADLAVLPGLLGRLDAETAMAIARDGEDSGVLIGNGPTAWAGPTAAWAGPTAVPEAAMPAAGTADAALTSEPEPAGSNVVPLLEAVNRRRARDKRRRRFVAAATGLVAACLAVVVGLGAAQVLQRTDTPSLTAMSKVAATVPVTAQIGLQPESGGTKLTMRCRYEGATRGRWSFSLVVVPTSGDPEEVSTWTAGSGDEFQLNALTDLSPDQIDRIEIKNSMDGRVLLVFDK